MPECTVAADCPDPGNECVERTCSAEGTCGTTPVADGTVVQSQTAGDCQSVVCDGAGTTKSIAADTDLPNDGKECTDDTCAAGVPTYTAKAINAACGAGGTLFCDGNGACVGCTGDSQCGQPTDCATPTCTAGSCVTNFTAVGTPLPNQTTGDCQEVQCNGIGGTKTVSKSADVNNDNNACTNDLCNGSTPAYTNVGAGAACSDGALGKLCNGAGSCVECLTAADCTSGVCTLQVCAAPVCTDQVKNGAETDVDCGGATCSPCANGKTCSANADCTSTVCNPMSNLCVASICGDNRITGTETCDDGGTTSGNGCSATCTIEAGYKCSGMPSVCMLACGDGVKDPTEGCDDGGMMSGNGCSATCTVEPGYKCSGSPSTCIIACSDGVIDAGETCDDGDMMSGDGCSSTCAIESGYVCTGAPSVCVESCGNGVVDAGETCDDGAFVNGDGCSSACATEVGYTCSGMPSSCVTTCGDGIVAGTEACDDDNVNSGDCCSATCTTESGCEIEPNDDDATANAFATVFVADKVKAFIEPSLDYDFFQIDVPANVVGSLALTTMNGPLGTTCASLNVDTNVTVYDSTLTQLGVNDDISATDYCSQLTVPNLVTGTYFIEVTSSPFVPSATFDYTLEAVLTLAPLVDECAMNTDDCVAGATCVDAPQAFTCTCPANLGGDGRLSGSGCATGLYYAFDGMGTTVPNLAVTPPLNALNATIVGAPTQGGTGKCNTALVGAGGTSDVNYVDTGWATNLTGSWTVSFWLENSVPPPPPNPDYLFGDSTAQSFRCFTGGVAGDNNIVLRGTGMAEVLLTGAANVAPTMTTYVYDAALGNIKGYINGALAATVAQTGPLTFVGPGPFKVGGYATTPALSNGARMDEFRLYHRALDATEVANLFNAPTCTP
jgi:cysteine-rich repeat protein